jgi:hypothetical protein
MNAALRFRLAAAVLLLGAVGLYNALDTGRAFDVSQWLTGGGALFASALALLLARWTQRGDAGPPPKWRVEMLAVAFAIPLVPIALTLLPWCLIALNQAPRTVDAILVAKEPVKGCALKVWLDAPPGDPASPLAGADRARCLDGVVVARTLRAGDTVRVVGRESWAGFVVDRLEQ